MTRRIDQRGFSTDPISLICNAFLTLVRTPVAVHLAQLGVARARPLLAVQSGDALGKCMVDMLPRVVARAPGQNGGEEGKCVKDTRIRNSRSQYKKVLCAEME